MSSLTVERSGNFIVQVFNRVPSFELLPQSALGHSMWATVLSILDPMAPGYAGSFPWDFWSVLWRLFRL